ncbi:MAG: AAA family ATPase, partial [Flavobacteriaceae bacterium]|nr:AAA family ATPase [Flavobacteriaceae bacterium]
KLFQYTWVSRKSKYFTEELYESFARILKPSRHTIEKGVPINLSPIQKELSISVEKQKKRIKGVAGSGKSLVLAQRAVNAHKRTGGFVLILTFNITLKNYLHDRISAVREEFDWAFFRICNYHEFIKSNMNNANISVKDLNLKTYDEKEFEDKIFSNLDLFEHCAEQLQKYEVILIDEAQDFKEKWIRMIVKYFANENAEIVAFADEKQNIYSRDLDSDKMPKIPVQVGAWDKRLNTSYRLSEKIATLAYSFQKHFFADKYDIENKIDTSYKPMLFDSKIEYHFVSLTESKSISKYIYEQIIKHKFNSNDITILSSEINILRELNEELQRISKEKTNIMFETQEEYECYKETMSLDNIRKTRKTNFWMNRGTFKLSTIQSFKGWETPVLFLVINKNIKTNQVLISGNENIKPTEFSDELIYTGMTRCKDSLFIINLNNKNYDDFFRNHPLVDITIDA